MPPHSGLESDVCDRSWHERTRSGFNLVFCLDVIVDSMVGTSRPETHLRTLIAKGSRLFVFNRYLLRLFAKVWFVWFASLTGMYFVVEVFTNLDEFIQISKSFGGWLAVLQEYFAPRIMSFFDRTYGLFALMSAICALAWMRMNNELTALMASGISNRQIIKPLLLAAMVMSVMGIANREFMLPRVRDKLARNAQDWAGSRARPLQPCYDHETDVFLNGRNAFTLDERIELPSFRLPRTISGFGPQISAKVAYHQRATHDRPSGYRFQGIEQPTSMADVPSAFIDGRPVVFSPHDTTWLEPDECFVVSKVDFDQLTGGASWRQYASMPQLIGGLRNRSLAYGADVRLEVHRRLVQPFLDMTLFVLGLPVVLSRKGHGVVVCTGLCLLLTTLFFVVVMACHAMGQRGFLLSPALAAWGPLIVFVPLARTASRSIWE